jgi:phosphate starvation-inducible protein PhoH and related proteins
MGDFNRTEKAEEVFKEKRRPKTPPKYKITLSDEQKEAKKTILDNQVTVLFGKAGTSKTTLASITALYLLHNGYVDRITLIRPTIATENIGFIPGDARTKMSPWFIPVMENLYDIYNKVSIDKDHEDGKIRFLPLQFAQGVNFKKEVVIFEEAENATEVQIRMALTRLCDGAKLIFTGDVAQIQLKSQKESGFSKLLGICDKIDGMACFELTENRRAKIVQDFLDCY